MRRNISATDARARLLVLLDQVAAGDEIEITKHGRTVARLVPAVGPNSLRGTLTGVAHTAAEEDDLFTTASTWDLR